MPATAIGTDTRGMPVSNGDRRRLTPIRVVIATAMVLAIGYVAAGCIFERRGDAEDLDRHIRAMPGVANTDMTYTNTFTSGERFDLNVTLQQDITEEQIQDVGRYFANRTDETGLAERSAYLSLRLPTVPPPTKNLYARGYQSASFSRGPYNTAHSPSGDDIAAAAAERDAMQAHEAPLLADHEYAGLDSPNQQRLLDAAVRAQDAGVPPEDIQAITELGGANGYDTAEIIRILDEEASQRGRATGGAGPAPESGTGAPARAGSDAGPANDGKPAGDDIDLDLLPQARDLVAAEPDAPIMMVDDLTETTAAQALADADAAIVEAETTYQRAAHAAAGCLLG